MHHEVGQLPEASPPGSPAVDTWTQLRKDIVHANQSEVFK